MLIFNNKLKTYNRLKCVYTEKLLKPMLIQIKLLNWIDIYAFMF